MSASCSTIFDARAYPYHVIRHVTAAQTFRVYSLVAFFTYQLRSLFYTFQHFFWSGRLRPPSTLGMHLTSWSRALSKGLLHVPLTDGWKDRQFLTHIVTVSTREDYIYWLYLHIMAASYCVFPVAAPIVPAGTGRLRVILHAENTGEQIIGLVNAIFVWVEEMIDIQEGGTGVEESSVVRQVNDWIRSEDMKMPLWQK